nr:hypothetical protein [Dankookia rubra]
MPFRTGRMTVSAPIGLVVLHRGVERICLYGEQDEVVGAAEVACLNCGRPEVSVAAKAVDAQSVARDLLGAGLPNQKCHVGSGFDQPAAEIAAQCAGTNHQNLHDALLDVRTFGTFAPRSLSPNGLLPPKLGCLRHERRCWPGPWHDLHDGIGVSSGRFRFDRSPVA